MARARAKEVARAKAAARLEGYEEPTDKTAMRKAIEQYRKEKAQEEARKARVAGRDWTPQCWWETIEDEDDIMWEARQRKDWTGAALAFLAMGMTEPPMNIYDYPGGPYRANLFEYSQVLAEMKRLSPDLEEYWRLEEEEREARLEYTRIMGQVAARQRVLERYTAPEDYITQWLIQRDIDKLKYKAAQVKGREVKRPTLEGVPIPDWMREYLEPSISGLERRPKGIAEPKEEIPWAERQAFALRPLGAQTELAAPELGMMAGYLGWGKAGAPLEFGEEYVRGMENLPLWWREYLAQSQKLFPRAARLPKPTWRTATQW